MNLFVGLAFTMRCTKGRCTIERRHVRSRESSPTQNNQGAVINRRFWGVSRSVESSATSYEEKNHSFGLFVASELKRYSHYTRDAIQHAISDIIFNADTGNCDRNKPLSVNPQTEIAPCVLFKHSEVNKVSNAEELRYGEGESVSPWWKMDLIFIQSFV